MVTDLVVGMSTLSVAFQRSVINFDDFIESGDRGQILLGLELNASLSLEIPDVSSILHSLESGLSKLGVVLFKEVFS